MNAPLNPDDEVAWRRKLASAANNRAWTLSEQLERTPNEDQEMLDAAHASAHLWRTIGNDKNAALGHLLLGQVHALLGHASEALTYANLAHDYFTGHDDSEAWEVAISHAVLAHAAHCTGDAALHAAHYAIAEQRIAALPDPQDQEILLATLRVVPKPPLTPPDTRPADAPVHQGVVVFTKNKNRVSAFYRRTLDLTAFEEAASHDVLRGHGLEVVVHAIPAKIAASIQITQPPQVREDTPIKPTFVVASLDAVRAAAQETGGFLKPAKGAWHFRGATVLDGHDPEGNVVQFKQLDAPGDA